MSNVNAQPIVDKITQFAIQIESKLALTYIYAAFPGLAAIRPVAWVIEWIVNYVVTKINMGAEKQAFFLNTVIRAADEAKDFEQKVDAKNNLPAEATDEDIRKAEQAQMDAFDDLFNLVDSRVRP